MQVFEGAKWIWLHNEKSRDEYGEFFAVFNSEKENAVCRISCDGDYTLFINGSAAGSNQYGDFEHYKIYDEIDISRYLQKGKNAIAILVWHYGDDFQRYKTAQAGLIFEICRNEQVLLASDERVHCRQSRAYKSGLCKRITNQMGFSFLYNASKEDNWREKGFDSINPSVTVNKTCTFYPRPTKKLQLCARKPVKILKNEKNYYLVDLGEETVGLPTMEFVSPAEQKITVCWGEDIQEGHVRRIIGDRDFSYEYIAKTRNNCYTNYMLRLGCRYLELYSEQEIQLRYLGLIPQVYPVNVLPFSLECGEDRRIYDVCVKTLQCSMMEHYVDTPWREQCLYAFDSRNQMLCGYYAFENGNAQYARAGLQLLSEDIRQDGLLPICAPCGVNLAIPSFSLHYVIAIGEYLAHTGDAAFVQEVFPRLLFILKAFIHNRHNGLVCRFSESDQWNFYDWSSYLEGNLFGTEKKEPDLIVNCLFIMALDSLNKICKRISVPFEYEALLSESRKNTAYAFYNADKKAYSLTAGGGEFTGLGNSLAIIAGIAENPAELCEMLADGCFTEASLSMKCFKYDALLMTDFSRWKDYVLEDIRRDYRKMLDAGATTVWETIEGASAFGNAGSLCHGWSAMPVYYYHKILKA